jgi:hypothetical protein
LIATIDISNYEKLTNDSIISGYLPTGIEIPKNAVPMFKIILVPTYKIGNPKNRYLSDY